MYELGPEICGSVAAGISREWLETNGLGGFASSTILGLNTRRYHGLLVAATTPPTGRVVLLSKLEETLVVEGRRYELSVNQYPGVFHPEGFQHLAGFRLNPFPIFTYRIEGLELTKSLCMVHGQNNTVVRYELRVPEGGRMGQIALEIRPLIAFRDYHSLTHENSALDPAVRGEPGVVTLRPYPGLPNLCLSHNASRVETTGEWYRNFEYKVERERGLEFREDLFQPCVLTWDLSVTRHAALIAATEGHDAALAAVRLAEESSRRKSIPLSNCQEPVVAALAAAADQFLVTRGQGSTIIAGYPWFTDWGRDTMIALPGLTLVTGRAEVAKGILSEFARHVDQGMLPNRFPDAGEAPEHNTIDASLWYFRAVHSLLRYTDDYEFVQEQLYSVLGEIVDWHCRGTRYGIHVREDGLLESGPDGAQLTWMDARVEGRVITPRAGCAVEIQALWYNALRVMESLADRFEDGDRKQECRRLANLARDSFRNLFWNAERECLYDVVDGNRRDGSIRPNQILAASLPHTMLTAKQAAQVLAVVERELLTPRGLRTLAPSDLHYLGHYAGSPAERDSAYHQGTAWPWLIGPYFTAAIRARKGSRTAREHAAAWLREFSANLPEAGLGQVSEVADGDPPHRPGGCIAQAWSVAELLRAALEDVWPESLPQGAITRV